MCLRLEKANLGCALPVVSAHSDVQIWGLSAAEWRPRRLGAGLFFCSGEGRSRHEECQQKQDPLFGPQGVVVHSPNSVAHVGLRLAVNLDLRFRPSGMAPTQISVRPTLSPRPGSSSFDLETNSRLTWSTRGWFRPTSRILGQCWYDFDQAGGGIGPANSVKLGALSNNLGLMQSKCSALGAPG